MYAGRVVESGPVDAILDAPLHPYTRGLLESIPSRNLPGRPLAQIPGMAPPPLALPEGCTFRDRCPRALPACAAAPAVSHPAAARTLRCVNPLQ
jgi:peptide/nickel transport system ATP-binding protein